jgi:ribonucleoside-triphosphate reductase
MFRLTDNFLDGYKRIRAPFGFGALGELTYMRTYSRIKEDGKNEVWWETVRRVVEGTYNMQKRHIDRYDLGWNPWQAQASAQEMYDRIFTMRFLPPGRGLWSMGSPITEEKGLYAALNNCAFVSTENIETDLAKPFCFLMDASMLGVGVGFDTKGAGKIEIKKVAFTDNNHVVPDTREGWVDAIRVLIEAYLTGADMPSFDVSQIRAAGEPIKGFGGVSGGSAPLVTLIAALQKILTPRGGELLSVTDIVDIMNLIGKCVVSGNVRRSAEIVFGDPDSEEYINLKNYKLNPHRSKHGYASNNSVFGRLGMDYAKIAERIKDNGEPGLAWLWNMQNFSRMLNGTDGKDRRVAGGNPCLEQSLEPYELCCLVETFPNNHESLEDYLRTLKYAYLYAKTVTLGKTHWPETNRVMLRNRRIGCSVSGIAQFRLTHTMDELREWLDTGYNKIQEYDKQYSDWMAIPRSIKTTSVKPSGTVSLLAGATPGIHHPESRFYIRRVRLANTSTLIKPLEKAGFRMEPDAVDDSATVVEVPVDVGEGIRSVSQVSMWEQMSMAAFMQKYWADNQVSCTVTFDPDKDGDQIAPALDYFQYQLKGISFLPKSEDGAYAQMPYEEISEQKYKSLTKNLSNVSYRQVKGNEAIVDNFCNNDSCELKGA